MKITKRTKLRVIFGQGSGAVVLSGITYGQCLDMLQGLPLLAFIDVSHDINAEPETRAMATCRHGIDLQIDIL